MRPIVLTLTQMHYNNNNNKNKLNCYYSLISIILRSLRIDSRMIVFASGSSDIIVHKSNAEKVA